MEEEDLDVLYKEINDKDLSFSMRYTVDEFKTNMSEEGYRAEMEEWLGEQGIGVKKKEESESLAEVADTESISTGEPPPILSESIEGVVDGEVTTEEVTEEEIPTELQWSTGEEEPVEELSTDTSYATTTPVQTEGVDETVEIETPDKDETFSFSDPSTWGLAKDVVVEENLMASDSLGQTELIDEEALSVYGEDFQEKVKKAKVKYDAEMKRRKELTKATKEKEKSERAASEKLRAEQKKVDTDLHKNIDELTVKDIEKDEDVLVKELNAKFGDKGLVFGYDKTSYGWAGVTGMGDAMRVTTQDGKFETTIDLQAFTDAGNLEGLAELQNFIRANAISNPEEHEKPITRIEKQAIDFYAERNLNFRTIQKAQNELSEVSGKMALIEKIQAGNGRIDTYSAKDVKMFPELFIDAEVGDKGVIAVPRSDLNEVYAQLVEDEDGLDNLLGLNLISDDVKVATEDFDEYAYKERKILKEKYALQNQVAIQQMSNTNEESLRYFGKPLMEITKEDIKTTEDYNKLAELDIMYEDGRFMQKQAGELWLDEQTFLSLQQNQQITGEYTDNWDGVSQEIAKGWNQGQACQQILSIAMDVGLRDPADLKKCAEDIVHAMMEQETYGTSRVMHRFNAAKGVGGVMEVFAKDPYELVGSLMGNSLSSMMPYGLGITLGSGAVGATTGGIIGATGFAAGPTGIVTTTGGIVAGGVQGLRIGMAATMFAMEYTNSILDVMREKGADLMNPESVAEYLAREDVWAEGGERGIKRGIPIAVIDYLSAGLAGKAFGATTSVTTSTTRRIGAIVGEQMIFGTGSEMLGEASAMFVAGQNLDAKEILAEGLGALGNNSANLAINVYQKTNQTAKIEYAEELTNINKIMSEKGNLDKVSDWTVRMLETGQIDDVTANKIQENIGIRRDVDKMVNLSVKDKALGAIDVRKSEGKIKERLAQLKAAERKYETSKSQYGPQITAINKEMNEILTTGKIPDKPLLLPTEAVTYKIENKKGEMKKVSKKKMENFLATATPQELYSTRIDMDNAPQHMLDKAKFATDKIDTDAIQKSSTESVDVRKQAKDGAAVGEGDTKGLTPEAQGQENIAISDTETQEVQPGQEVQSEVGHKVQYGFQDGQYFKIVDGVKENITARTHKLETERMSKMGQDMTVDENGMTTEVQTSEGSGGQQTKFDTTEAVAEAVAADKTKDTYDAEIKSLEDKKKTIIDEGTEIVEDAEIREPEAVTDETVIVEPTTPETRVNPEAQAEADKIDAQIKDLQAQKDAVVDTKVETETETETETDKKVSWDDSVEGRTVEQLEEQLQDIENTLEREQEINEYYKRNDIKPIDEKTPLLEDKKKEVEKEISRKEKESVKKEAELITTLSPEKEVRAGQNKKGMDYNAVFDEIELLKEAKRLGYRVTPESDIQHIRNWLANEKGYAFWDVEWNAAESKYVESPTTETETEVKAEVKVEEKTEAPSVTLAPYFNTNIKTVEDANKLRQNEDYKTYKKNLVDLGKDLGIEVEIEETIGGYMNDAGEKIVEISNKVNLPDATIEQAEEYASLMGALTPEVQEATIAAQYTDVGSTEHNANEMTVKVSDPQAAMDALKVADITDYTLNETTGEITFLDFDTEMGDLEMTKKIGKFVTELEKNGQTIEQEDFRPIESRYVDSGKRKSVLRKAKKERADSGQSGKKLREKIQSAVNRDAEFQGITPEEYATVDKATKPNKDDVAAFRKDGEVKESVLSYIADKKVKKKPLTKFEKEVAADKDTALEEIVSLKIQLEEEADIKSEASQLKLDLGISSEANINMRLKSENPATKNEAEMERITNEINKKGAKTPNVAVQVVEETDIAKPDTKEMSERVGVDVKTVKLSVIKGIPVVFNISDQLTVGNVTNPATGREIKGLSGGMLFGYTQEGKGKAWASIDEKTAQDKVNEAQTLYDANKEIYHKWWAENPEYEGVVPMAIVKMGEDSMNSNEAVFRVLADNLKNVDSKRKDKAFKALPSRLKKLAKDNLKAAKNTSNTQVSRDAAKKKAAALTKAMASIKKENITNLDQLLTTWLPNQATPLRAVFLDELTVGNPRIAGQNLTKSNVTASASPVKKALVGWTNKKSKADMKNDIALIDRGLITDLITEPGLKDVPQRSMVSIQGVNVNDADYKKKNGKVGLNEAGVSKGTHSNYKGAINGMTIGILDQPEQVHNIFPKLFAETVSGVQAAEQKGQDKGYGKVSKTEAGTKEGKEQGKKEGDVKPMSMVKNLANKLVVQLGLNKFKTKGDLEFESQKGKKKGQKNVTKEGHVSTGETLNDVNKLAAWLNRTFPSVKVNITPETFETVVNHPDVKTKVKDGQVIYGITKDGDIYINPEAHNSNSEMSNTLIHEYGHIMLDYLATTPEGKKKLAAGLSLAEQNKEVFDAQLKKFKGDKQRAANETLAIMIGNKGETITNAALKSEFQEWLIGMWEYIKDAYSSLKDMSVEEVQNLTLDEFVGAAVRDILQGKDMKLTTIQENKLKNPEVAFREGMSVSEIINQGRAQEYSDASIRQVLKEQFPSMSMEDIKSAMAVQPDLFSMDVPPSFGNVEGGMSEGVQMFTRIQEKLREFANQEQRTPQQMREKAQSLLKADETYKNERGNTTLQKHLQIELDSALNITQEGRTLNRRLTELKSQLRQREIGVSGLKKVQAKLKAIIREALPKTNYSAAQIQKAINIVNKATPETIDAQMEKVIALVQKKQTEMKTAEINAWTKLATTLGKKVTDAASKVKSNLRVDAKGQQFFETASKVLKAATIINPERRAKALAVIGKKLFVTNRIKTKDAQGNTVYEDVQQIGTLNPYMEEIVAKYNNDEVLTTKEQYHFNLLSNYDTLSDIVNKDLNQVRSILNELSDEQGKSAADLAANRLAVGEKNRQLQEAATKSVENSFGSLIFAVDPRTGKPEYGMQNLTRAEKAKFEAAVIEEFGKQHPDKINEGKQVGGFVEIDGKRFEVSYIPAKIDPTTNKPFPNSKPKYKVKVMKRELAGKNELKRRFPALQDVRNATKLGKWLKSKGQKFKENPTSFFNVMSWGQNLGTMTRMLDETGNFFEKNVYQKLNRMTERAMSGLFAQRDHMDNLANKVNVNGKKNKKGIKGIQNDKNVKKTHTITLHDKVGGLGIDFTGSQLMRIYALSKNENQRNKLMKHNKLKFTEESFQQIEAALGEDVLTFTDSVVDYLSNAYFESVNGVYQKVNNVSMNYVDNYFPTRTDTGVSHDSDLIQEGDFQTVFSAQYATALKERTDTQGEVETDFGFFAEMDNHFEQMENFKAMSQGVKELNTLFQAPGVKKALETMGSEKYMRQLLNVTINPNSFIPEVSSTMEKFFSNFTQYVLGFKLAQIVKQGSSFVTAFEDYQFNKGEKKSLTNNLAVDVMGFMFDTLLNMANPVQLYKNYNQAKKMSATFRHRMENKDIYALESGRGTRKSGSGKWRSISAFPTILGDAIGVMGYMINYRRDIANGMSPEAAAEKFNAYNETQQTRRTQDLTPLQAKKNFIYRGFLTFGSTSILQMNKVMVAGRNIIIKSLKEKKAPRDKDIRALALNLGLANATFIFASNFMRWGFGDPGDRDEIKEEMLKGLIGAKMVGTAVPIAGALFEEMYDVMSGNKNPYDKSPLNPLAEMYKKMNRSYNEPDSDKAVIEMSRQLIGIFTGFNSDPFVGMYDLVKDFGGMDSEGWEHDVKDLSTTLGVSKSYQPTMMDLNNFLRHKDYKSWETMKILEETMKEVMEAQLEEAEAGKRKAEEKVLKGLEKSAGRTDYYQSLYTDEGLSWGKKADVERGKEQKRLKEKAKQKKKPWYGALFGD